MGLLEAEHVCICCRWVDCVLHVRDHSPRGGAEVGDVLHSGEFGFADETGAGMNRAIKAGMDKDIGFAQAIGEWILSHEHPFKDYSLIATCVEKGLPVTAHVAMGTDIIHQHPEMDGAVTGEMSYRDFRLITSVVADLGDGELGDRHRGGPPETGRTPQRREVRPARRDPSRA